MYITFTESSDEKKTRHFRNINTITLIGRTASTAVRGIEGRYDTTLRDTIDDIVSGEGTHKASSLIHYDTLPRPEKNKPVISEQTRIGVTSP